MKRKKEGIGSEQKLGKAYVSYYGKSAFGEVYRKKFTGKLSGERGVAFSFSLPCLEGAEGKETEAFFSALACEFLSFLEEKSRLKGEDAFGGLSFSLTKQGVLISAAFCSVRERNYFPAVEAELFSDGRLKRVKKHKNPLR